MSPAPKDLWSNEETWLVQLWLMDNAGANEIAKKAAREAWESAKADPVGPVDRVGQVESARPAAPTAGQPLGQVESARPAAPTPKPATTPLSRIDNATVALAHWLQDSIESNNPLSGRERDMYGELMTHALDRVNWREIARHWIDELAA